MREVSQFTAEMGIYRIREMGVSIDVGPRDLVVFFPKSLSIADRALVKAVCNEFHREVRAAFLPAPTRAGGAKSRAPWNWSRRTAGASPVTDDRAE